MVHWSPRRGLRGQLLRPVLVRLAPASSRGPAPLTQDVLLPVEAHWLDEVTTRRRSAAGRLPRHGSPLEGRGRRCSGCAGREPFDCVCRVGRDGPLAVDAPTSGLSDGRLRHWDGLGRCRHAITPWSCGEGDRLVLTGPGETGRSALCSADGTVLTPACIPCTLPQVFGDLLAGQRILFDDGKIGGLIEEVARDRLRVRITQCARRARLRADKGINLPDSRLNVASLRTRIWRTRLCRRRCGHGRLVVCAGLPRRARSGTRTGMPRGVALGIILKVETRAAFDQLPNLLLRRCVSRRSA